MFDVLLVDGDVQTVSVNGLKKLGLQGKITNNCRIRFSGKEKWHDPHMFKGLRVVREKPFEFHNSYNPSNKSLQQNTVDYKKVLHALDVGIFWLWNTAVILFFATPPVLIVLAANGVRFDGKTAANLEWEDRIETQQMIDRRIDRMIRDDKERRHSEAFGDFAPFMNKTWE
jgi:hypothetical protein